MIAVFNVIDFSTLSSKKVTFGFKLAQIHQKLIVRAALWLNLTQPTHKYNHSNGAVRKLKCCCESIFGNEYWNHYRGWSCSHSIDIFHDDSVLSSRSNLQKTFPRSSIFYDKCETYCGSNDCPNTKPYFKLHHKRNVFPIVLVKNTKAMAIGRLKMMFIFLFLFYDLFKKF